MMHCLASHATELAIRAAIHLALQPPGKPLPTREIAADSGLPAAYLAKIMRLLIRAGLVRAFHGPGGGVELGRPADSISLASLVRAVEGEAQAQRCILGLSACSESEPCLLHAQWVPLRAAFSRMLDETSLDMLVQEAKRRRPSQFAGELDAAAAAPHTKSKRKASKRQTP